MLKRMICVLFALLLVLGATACASDNGKSDAAAKSVAAEAGKTTTAASDEPQTVGPANAGEDTSSNGSSGVPESEAESTTSGGEQGGGVVLFPDEPANCIDLTKMNSTMVYSQVYDMLYNPDDYLGRTVKMNGSFAVGEGNDRYYFACIIADATACCKQGIEFILADGRSYPSEYPEIGSEITVMGVFDTYYEGNNMYYQLIDAVMS